MIVPYSALEVDTLNALVEEFVSRDGTDYGDEEVSLAEKVSEVKRMLKSGEAAIVFVASTGDCNIVRADSLS